MNILRFANVGCYGHTRVGQLEGHRLGFAEFGPGAAFLAVAVAGGEIGQLHKQKRKRPGTGFLPIPPGAPVLNQQRKRPLILIGPSCIRLALIPDYALHSHRNQRVNHGVVEQGSIHIGLIFDGCQGIAESRNPGYCSSKARVGFHGLAAGPCFGMSATPGGIHQADGYVEFSRQIAGEEIAHRRKIAHRSRAAYLPFARYIGQGLYGSRFLHFEMTDLWVVGILNFFSRIGRVFYYPLHIRLPRTDPHLAHQHVLHDSGIGFALYR